MKKMSKLLITGLCAVMIPAVVAGQGQSNGKGKGHAKHGQNSEQDRDDDRDGKDDGDGDNRADRGARDQNNRRTATVFNSRDRRIISDYYRNRNSNLPPGLAKRNGNLPPGLQKQLQRNGTLPPGLQKRLEPLSGDLESRLPRLPVDYRRGVIGQDVVVYNTRTQRIMDVVHAVLGR